MGLVNEKNAEPQPESLDAAKRGGSDDGHQGFSGVPLPYVGRGQGGGG